jgi:hypothetical protein
VKTSEKISAAIPAPANAAQSRPFLLPPWYLPNGTIYANDDQPEEGSSSCERWAIGCGVVVVISVIAELVLAIVHPSYDSPWERWGLAAADALIALGIVGEVLFGMWDSRIQTELRGRSNKKLADATTGAAEANERAGKANQRAEEASLELAKFKAPRTLDKVAFAAQLERKPKSRVVIWYLQEVSDAFRFSLEIFIALREAAWDVEWPIPFPDSLPEFNDITSRRQPKLVIAGGQAHGGITVVSSATDGDQNPSREALVQALFHGAGMRVWRMHVSSSSKPAVERGTLRLIIAAKHEWPVIPNPPSANASARE